MSGHRVQAICTGGIAHSRKQMRGHRMSANSAGCVLESAVTEQSLPTQWPRHNLSTKNHRKLNLAKNTAGERRRHADRCIISGRQRLAYHAPNLPTLAGREPI